MVLEEVRAQLYKLIEMYGLEHVRTIQKSQELDEVILKSMGK